MHAYRVVSIEKTEDIPHSGAHKGKWYRYIITNGISTITGCRSGKLDEVRDYLNDVIQRMNSDYNIKSSRKVNSNPISKPCFSSESYVAGYN